MTQQTLLKSNFKFNDRISTVVTFKFFALSLWIFLAFFNSLEAQANEPACSVEENNCTEFIPYTPQGGGFFRNYYHPIDGGYPIYYADRNFEPSLNQIKRFKSLYQASVRRLIREGYDMDIPTRIWVQGAKPRSLSIEQAQALGDDNQISVDIDVDQSSWIGHREMVVQVFFDAHLWSSDDFDTLTLSIHTKYQDSYNSMLERIEYLKGEPERRMRYYELLGSAVSGRQELEDTRGN